MGSQVAVKANHHRPPLLSALSQHLPGMCWLKPGVSHLQVFHLGESDLYESQTCHRRNAVKEYVREVCMCSSLNHPNICRFVGASVQLPWCGPTSPLPIPCTRCGHRQSRI